MVCIRAITSPGGRSHLRTMIWRLLAIKDQCAALKARLLLLLPDAGTGAFI